MAGHRQKGVNAMPARARALLLANGSHAAREESRELLVTLFRDEAGLEVDLSNDPADLTPERIQAADIILDYNGTPQNTGTSRLALDDDQVRAILRKVERGTPYIGMHAASGQFEGQLPMLRIAGGVHARNVPGWKPLWQQRPEDERPSPPPGPSPADDASLSEAEEQYLAMVGSAFMGHPALTSISVRILDHEHPITRGVSDFEIECEHYELAGDLSQLQVLADAGGQPVLYTKRWGEGAVHYTTLGHDHRALRHPSHRRLLVQAVGWALATG
jgi:type 1 glutamine amidotransferase